MFETLRTALLKAFEIPNLDNITESNELIFKVGETALKVNVTTLVMTWIVMAMLIGLAYLGVRRLEKFPGRVQALIEWIIDGLDGLTKDTIGQESGRKYFPLFATIFFFVLISNWLGSIPFFKSPTADLNTTLGLGLLVFFIVQGSAIWTKGLGHYLKGFLEPMMLAPLMLPLNIIGEFAKLTSHSFRLFGNILGGGLVILIISELTYYLILPIGLNGFFGFFVGTVQAFVFAMLAITYISVARA
ncbi:MAG: F0F1 ATP synthase subunit A [bacterium]